MLKVVFITQGYPSINRPNNGIFLHRSVKVLSRHISPFVVHFRTWTPRRRIMESCSWEGIPVLTISLPQVPFHGALHFNVSILTNLGFYLAGQYMESAQLIHSANFYPSGFIGSRWAMKLNIPHVSQAIGSDIHKYILDSRLLDSSQQWLNYMDGVGCVSEELQTSVKLLVPNLPNLRIARPGVNTVLFHPEGTTGGPQVGQPPVRFLYLGGFQTWNPRTFERDNYKGGALLLRTWQEVETRLGSSSLLIGGPGSSIEQLEKWRTKLKRPEAVFILGSVNPEKVPGLMRACNVVIIPSFAEGLPNLANEAQACGRPVLGSDAGGIPESVLDKQTGLIFPVGNSAALIRNMLWCWENQNKLKVMGVNARQHIQEKFSWDGFSQNVLELYDKAIEHHAIRNRK